MLSVFQKASSGRLFAWPKPTSSALTFSSLLDFYRGTIYIASWLLYSRSIDAENLAFPPFLPRPKRVSTLPVTHLLILLVLVRKMTFADFWKPKACHLKLSDCSVWNSWDAHRVYIIFDQVHRIEHKKCMFGSSCCLLSWRNTRLHFLSCLFHHDTLSHQKKGTDAGILHWHNKRVKKKNENKV